MENIRKTERALQNEYTDEQRVTQQQGTCAIKDNDLLVKIQLFQWLNKEVST